MALRVFSKETAGWGEGPKFKCYSFSLTSGGTFISLGVAELTFASVNEKIILLHHPTVLSSHETPIRTVYKKTKKKQKKHFATQETWCVIFIVKGRVSMVGWLIRREERKLSKMIPGFLLRASVIWVGKRNSMRLGGVWTVWIWTGSRQTQVKTHTGKLQNQD